MYVCMYVCVFVWMCLCMYVCMYAYVYVCMYVFMCVYLYVYVCICLYTLCISFVMHRYEYYTNFFIYLRGIMNHALYDDEAFILLPCFKLIELHPLYHVIC